MPAHESHREVERILREEVHVEMGEITSIGWTERADFEVWIAFAGDAFAGIKARAESAFAQRGVPVRLLQYENCLGKSCGRVPCWSCENPPRNEPPPLSAFALDKVPIPDA